MPHEVSPKARAAYDIKDSEGATGNRPMEIS